MDKISKNKYSKNKIAETTYLEKNRTLSITHKKTLGKKSIVFEFAIGSSID